MAAFGTPLPADLLAGGPAATGGRKGTYSPAVEAFAAELAHQTQANVRTLRAALGSLAAPAPAIDISVDNTWNKLAAAVFNKTGDQPLTPKGDPYDNDVFFLHAAFILQDVSVASLRGVSPVATNDEAQSLIAGLLGANAYAGGSVRTRLASRLAVRTPWGATVADVVDAISSLFQRLSDQAGGNAGNQAGASLAARRSSIPLWVPADVDIPSISDARQIIQQRLMDARQSAQQVQQSQQQSQQQQPQQQQGMNAATPGGGARRLMQAAVQNPNAAQSMQQQPQQQQQQQQPSGSGDTSAQEQQARVRQGRALQIAAVDPATGLAFSRTPDQTLGILYGTGNAQQPGGFFPQGINGQMK